MPAALAWHLGARYLSRRRTAWLAGTAVLLSVAIPVMVVGVMQGFVDITARQVQGSECDLTARAPLSSELPYDPLLMERLAAEDMVAAVAPYARRDAVMTPQLGHGDDARYNAGSQVEGIDWRADLAVGRLRSATLHPRPAVDLSAPPLTPEERGTGFLTQTWRAHLALTGLDLAAGMGAAVLPPPRYRPRPGAVLGRELIYHHGPTLFAPGTPISLTIPDGYGGRVGSVNAEVSDTIGTGVYEFDRTRVLLPLGYGRDLAAMDRRDSVSGYRIDLHEGVDLHAARAQLSDTFPHLEFATWRELGSRNLLKSLQMQRNVIGFVMICIQCICLFIIYAVFSTLVTEKRHDIGVLLGLGAPARAIRNAFLCAGAMCCLVGGALGWVLGWAGLAALNPISQHSGIALFPQDVIYTPEAPISWNPLIPLTFIAIITVIGLIAVALPAWRAARIDPIASLREPG